MIITEIQISIQDHQLWAKHIICIMPRHLVAKCKVAPDLHFDYYYNPYIQTHIGRLIQTTQKRWLQKDEIMRSGLIGLVCLIGEILFLLWCLFVCLLLQEKAQHFWIYCLLQVLSASSPFQALTKANLWANDSTLPVPTLPLNSLSSRVTLIVALPPILTSLRIISS